jgi:ribose transport system permease protein
MKMVSQQAQVGQPAVEDRPVRERFYSVFRTHTWVAPAFGLVLMYLAFGLINPRFFSADNLQAVLNQAAIPLTAAVGATLVILAREIDLSIEGIMATASMVMALLTANQLTEFDLGFWGILIAVLVGLVMGLTNGILVTWLKIPSFLATFAMWFIGLGIASYLFDIAGGRAPRLLDESLRQLSSTQATGLNWITVAAFGVLIVFWLIQRYTVIGRHIYAIGNDEETARISGVKVNRTKIVVFALAGACAGLAGAMAALRSGVGSVRAGEDMVFTVISAVVIGGTFLTGGRGGVFNTLIGLLIVGGLRLGLILIGVEAFLQQTVQGFILLAVVLASTWQLRDRLRVVK